MTGQYAINNLMLLSSDEEDFKQLHSEYMNHQIFSPHSIEEMKPILKTLAVKNISAITGFFTSLESFLSENVSYLPSSSDLAIIRHIRYLPPIIHSHAFIEIIYVLNGHCSNTINDNTFTMSTGDICIIAPDVKHHLFVSDDESIILNILVRRSTFDTAFFGLFSNKDVIADFFIRILYGSHLNPYIIFKTGNNEKIRNLLMDMLSEFDSDKDYSNRFMNIYFMMLCVNILRDHEKDAIVLNPNPNIQAENIVLILRYIYNSYNVVTLSSLAKMFNYSEAHLSRLIKVYTGNNFSEIIRNIRIHKAAELLSNPHISIN